MKITSLLRQLLLSCRGAEEERDPERDDFRILFRIETILPFAAQVQLRRQKYQEQLVAEKKWSQRSSWISCGVVSY